MSKSQACAEAAAKALPRELRLLAVVLLVAVTVSAGAVELRRGRVAIDFPAQPLMDEATELTVAGPIQRFVAVAVTPTCDYALFEYTYPDAYVQAIGEDALLPFAVSESVSRYSAGVRSLERGTRAGNALVDMTFTTPDEKGEGQARFLHLGNIVYEATVLCLSGQGGDGQFLPSLRVL